MRKPSPFICLGLWMRLFPKNTCRFLNRRVGILGVMGVLLNPLAGGAALVEESHCDLLGSNLKSVKVSTSKECASLCQSTHACLGYTFISGWQRCFLKEKVKRKVALTLFSGESSQDPREDFDYSGKDLVQIKADYLEECASRCKQNDKCVAFTYLRGYHTCWLKQSKGSFFEKIFYCGVRVPAPKP